MHAGWRFQPSRLGMTSGCFVNLLQSWIHWHSNSLIRLRSEMTTNSKLKTTVNPANIPSTPGTWDMGHATLPGTIGYARATVVRATRAPNCNPTIMAYWRLQLCFSPFPVNHTVFFFCIFSPCPCIKHFKESLGCLNQKIKKNRE